MNGAGSIGTALIFAFFVVSFFVGAKFALVGLAFIWILATAAISGNGEFEIIATILSLGIVTLMMN